MANRLKVADVRAIIGLLELRRSYRRIACKLKVHRETVARYDRLRQTASSKPANAPPGYTGFELPDPLLGPPSLCKPFEAVIKK